MDIGMWMYMYSSGYFQVKEKSNLNAGNIIYELSIYERF